MENIGERHILFYIPGTDIFLPGGVNPGTIESTLAVMAFVLLIFWLGVRRLEKIPGRGQMVMEIFAGLFDGLVASSLELETREKNRAFLPLIFSLFFFIIFANWSGFIPGSFPEEPTADLNTTLSLGIMGMVIATFCSIKVKGPKTYFVEFLGPMWEGEEGASFGVQLAGKLSAGFFFPLNLIGECAKVISISFRIFGNILGGGIIFAVISTLVYNFGLPLGMNVYFVFFAGAVQAFVFTMLTLTYISVAIK